MKILKLISLLIPLTVFSQNITKLDFNNGFRKFKFGTSASQIANIEPTGKKYNNMDEYSYVGNDINTIQEVKTSAVNLYFLEGKLATVIIAFGYTEDYTQEEYNQVNYGLTNSFGKPNVNCTPSQAKVIDCKIWIGSKVRLEHSRSYGYQNSTFGILIFEDIKMRQKRINSDF